MYDSAFPTATPPAGGLQGTGDTKGSLYISLVSQVQSVWGLEAWHIWQAILIGPMTRALLSVIRFRQGAWLNIEVEIEPAR